MCALQIFIIINIIIITPIPCHDDHDDIVPLKPELPQILQNPQRGTFLTKISTVGNWYFHLFKWDKITTWQEVQAISAEYERSTKMHRAL